MTSRLTELLATRAVLRRVRKMRSVARSSLATICCLTRSWIGDSAVHRKRVPMLTASAPSASAATRPRASPMPPDAMSGMDTWSAAAGMSTRPGTSSSPGWPAHSKPSIETASTPRLSALRAWRTEVALWMTLMPCLWNSWTCSAGLEPAVSTMSTPDSMIAWRYSAYGGGLIAGRIVRLTPKTRSVSSHVRAISSASASGVGWVSAVRNPSAPALATAATRSARPTHCIPPCTIGCSTPKVSVKRVLSMGSGGGGRRCLAPCRGAAGHVPAGERLPAPAHVVGPEVRQRAADERPGDARRRAHHPEEPRLAAAEVNPEALPQLGRQQGEGVDAQLERHRRVEEPPEPARRARDVGRFAALEGRKDLRDRRRPFELLGDRAPAVGLEVRPLRRQVPLAHADETTDPQPLVEERLLLGGGHLAHEVPVALHDGQRERGVDPGEGLGLHRVVALAVRRGAADRLVHPAHPSAEPAGLLRAAVDGAVDVVERPQQPAPRVLEEGRVLVHAVAHGRIGDLQERRVARRREQADVVEGAPNRGSGPGREGLVLVGRRQDGGHLPRMARRCRVSVWCDTTRPEGRGGRPSLRQRAHDGQRGQKIGGRRTFLALQERVDRPQALGHGVLVDAEPPSRPARAALLLQHDEQRLGQAPGRLAASRERPERALREVAGLPGILGQQRQQRDVLVAHRRVAE